MRLLRWEEGKGAGKAQDVWWILVFDGETLSDIDES